jgi:hypothetical protein
VHVINERMRHEGVERGVDGCGARVEVEGAMGQIAYHFVFVLKAPVEALQRLELIHVKGGKAIERDSADIAARPFDPEDGDLLAGQRVCFGDFRGRVPAAVIGDALVETQQVRAIDQALGLGHGGRPGVVPQVFEARGRWSGHRFLPSLFVYFYRMEGAWLSIINNHEQSRCAEI